MLRFLLRRGGFRGGMGMRRMDVVGLGLSLESLREVKGRIGLSQGLWLPNRVVLRRLRSRRVMSRARE